MKTNPAIEIQWGFLLGVSITGNAFTQVKDIGSNPCPLTKNKCMKNKINRKIHQKDMTDNLVHFHNKVKSNVYDNEEMEALLAVIKVLYNKPEYSVLIKEIEQTIKNSL